MKAASFLIAIAVLLIVLFALAALNEAAAQEIQSDDDNDALVKACYQLIAHSTPDPISPRPEITGYNHYDMTGIYFGGGNLWCDSESNCLHEIAHAMDEFYDFPSGSEQFKSAVAEFIQWCDYNNVPLTDPITEDEFCNIRYFPGIEGNPLSDGWGGYADLYAHIYAISKYFFNPIPSPINKFYSSDWQLSDP